MNHLLSTADITKNGENKEFSRNCSQVLREILYIVSVDSDLLFTDSQNRDTFYQGYVEVKKNVFYNTIKSIHGHDAFLIEFDQLTSLLTNVFKNKSLTVKEL